MAFFLTMPISNITPIMAITLNSVSNAMSVSSAPTPAEGKVDKMVSGCNRLSYNTPNTKYKVTKAANLTALFADLNADA
jgi:hypothetical protein